MSHKYVSLRCGTLGIGMQSVGIIGYGRFGQLLARILETDFRVKVYERRKGAAETDGFETVAFEQLSTVDTIFLAVPISALKKVLQDLTPIVQRHQLVVDICSVKVYPAALMRRYLSGCQLLATHPLFGPDSAKAGLAGLELVVCPLQISDETMQFWRNFWQSKGIKIITSSPEEHDKAMLYSLGFTYLAGHLIAKMQIPELPFETKSYEKLKLVGQVVAHDSPTLLHDMLYYNPYTDELIERFRSAGHDTLKTVDTIAAELQNRPLL